MKLTAFRRQHIVLEVGLAVAVAGELAVVVERCSRRPSGRRERPRATPTSPADGRLVRVVVQVLADQRGVVAGALEPHREVVVGVQRLEAREAAVRRLVAPHAVVVGVLAGQERGPRRAAEREVDEAVRERRPWAPISELTFCITFIDSPVWSSVSITSTFGLSLRRPPGRGRPRGFRRRPPPARSSPPRWRRPRSEVASETEGQESAFAGLAPSSLRPAIPAPRHPVRR